MPERMEDIVKQVATIFKPAEKLTVAEWAQRHRYINLPGAHVGLWSADKTPYMVEPMEVLTSLNYTGMVFVGPARTGKALALDTPIPTPSGWTTMGELREGGRLFDERGNVCSVTFHTETMLDHDCFNVTFDDGSEIVADAGHKWFVHDIYGSKSAPHSEKVVTTEDIYRKWRIDKGNGAYRSRYAIPVTKALDLPEKSLPLDPYALGVWLGDGSTQGGYLTLNLSDAGEISAKIAGCGDLYVEPLPSQQAGRHAVVCAVRKRDGSSLISILTSMGLGDRGDGKFIPSSYLRASEEQRKELLRGLMDTDGTVDGRQPTYEFVTVFPALKDGISELLNSLGIKHCVTTKEPFYTKDGVRHYCQTAYRVTFSWYQPEDVWGLSRQIAKARESMLGRKLKPSQIGRRWVRSVTKVASVPVRCITVDSDSHLFLAGRDMVPTHNSDAFWNWAGYTAENDPTDMLLYGMTQSRASELGKGVWSKFVRAKKPEDVKSVMQKLLTTGKQNIFDKSFNNGMELLIRWPSITELSGKTVARVWIEDYDRIQPNPDDIDNQGTAFDLAKKRTTTFKRFAMTGIEASPGFEVTDMNWIASSPHEAPPTRGILSIYNRGDRRRWYWRCPHCEEPFQPTFELLRYPEYGDNLERAEQTYMECPHSGCIIEASSKNDLNRNGKWLKEGEVWEKDGSVSGKGKRSDIASFWMQGPAAGFQDWKGLVLAYLDAMDEYERTQSLGALKKTQNTDQGVPFTPPRNEMARLPEALKARSEDWGCGSDYESRKPCVPPWVRFLVATIDVQARSFVVQITGIGAYGEMTVIDTFKIRTSNRVDENDIRKPLLPIDPAGYAEDWDMIVSEVIEKTYLLSDGSGRSMPIKVTGCDSGGADGVTTNAIKFWLKLQKDPSGHHRRFHLVKGDKVREGMWLRQTSFYESKGNASMAFFAGKVPFQRLNSNALKDRLNILLMREDAGGARMRFASFLPDWFYKQMCAEERIAGKGWEAPKASRRNEAFDLSYYAIAMCVHSEINIDRINWEDETKVPSWAREWDKNDFIIQPDKKQSYVTKREVGDLKKIAADFL